MEAGLRVAGAIADRLVRLPIGGAPGVSAELRQQGGHWDDG